MIVGLPAMLVGIAFCFGGFRLFLVLLPLWAALAGFQAGAQIVAAILGTGFLGDVLGIVVGLAVGLGFAVVSYLVYGAAVAALGLFAGYALGSGLITGLTGGFDLLAAGVGLALGAVFAIGTLALNVPKWAVLALTALAGASLAVAGAFVMAGRIPLADLQGGLVGSLVLETPLLLLVVLGLAAAGIWVQSARSHGMDAVDVSGYRL